MVKRELTSPSHDLLDISLSFQLGISDAAATYSQGSRNYEEGRTSGCLRTMAQEAVRGRNAPTICVYYAQNGQCVCGGMFAGEFEARDEQEKGRGRGECGGWVAGEWILLVVS
jgi:hypothetical protein